MENETKYSLIIVVVAVVALIAFNSDLFTGQTIVRSAPTTFRQESINLVRSIDVFPNQVSNGKTIKITVVSTNVNDLIQKSKEKIIIYNSNGRFKKQLDRPRCIGTTSAECYQAEKTYAIPYSWENGKYEVRIERGSMEDGKYVKEILGKASFTLN